MRPYVSVYGVSAYMHSVIGSSMQAVSADSVPGASSGAYVYGPGTSLEGKMANFHVMCCLFRI